jgi:ubiquinone/menaquinone biosynthesis C-methylase UbiE
MTKAYKGMALEGRVATWYTRTTGRDPGRFATVADALAEWAPPGARVLELAPGPGFLAVELARRGYRVAAVDISHSFVGIARRHAADAGVEVDVRQGDAAHLPFPPESFEAVVCVAAFKNFSDPLGALDEVHRVLVPGGSASIMDLRKEASRSAIAEEVARMNLSGTDALFTRLSFSFMLRRTAYSRQAVERLIATSRFRFGEIREQGVGFELRLLRPA